jgi:hypothetical protein
MKFLKLRSIFLLPNNNVKSPVNHFNHLLSLALLIHVIRLEDDNHKREPPQVHLFIFSSTPLLCGDRNSHPEQTNDPRTLTDNAHLINDPQGLERPIENANAIIDGETATSLTALIILHSLKDVGVQSLSTENQLAAINFQFIMKILDDNQKLIISGKISMLSFFRERPLASLSSTPGYPRLVCRIKDPPRDAELVPSWEGVFLPLVML